MSSYCCCSSCSSAYHLTSLSAHVVAHTSTTSSLTCSKMPSAHNWKVVPWATIEHLFQEHQSASASSGTSWEQHVQQFFSSHLTADVVNALPSLNVNSRDASSPLLDGQLVRFRCMIQDMFDPEFYLNVFQIRDLSSGKTRLATGKYRDVTQCGPREEVEPEAAGTVNGDRLSFYCVSVPGEAPWVREAFRHAEQSLAEPVASCSKTGRSNKRSLDDDEEEMMEDLAENDSEKTVPAKDVEMEEGGAPPASGVKKVKTAESKALTSLPSTASSSAGPNLNLPLPDPHGQAAIVKIYDADAKFSLNDCVEFVGIVSLDPSLASFSDDADAFAQFNREESQAKSPPPSLVPRLHVLQHRKLTHSNPHFASPGVELPSTLSAEQRLQLQGYRQQLHQLLTTALLGDAAAADYLICHLISKVYLRKDALTLGKFSLNLHNVPVQDNYPKRVATLLQMLLCKSHYLPMSVEQFNGSSFVPKKDYQANRLVTGLLQLSKHTHLILDETAMSNGQLSPDGLKNLAAVGNVISWQKLEYNFNFHQLEFQTDVPCLVLSEGRSLLPSDCQVMLKPAVGGDVDEAAVKKAFAAVGTMLTPDLLNNCRKYLTVARHLAFEFTDEIQEVVQKDFVQARQAAADAGVNAAERMSTDDLHLHLVLARLVALSACDSGLNMDVWQRAKDLEKERAQRVAHLPARPRPSGPLARQMV